MGNKHFVYKHTLKSDGRVYFGQTSNLKQRWRNNGDAYKGCPRFYNAIQKYGWDAFDHEIVCGGLNNIQANILEKSLILYFRSFDEDKGFNATFGGKGALCHKTELGGMQDAPIDQFTLDGEKIKTWESAVDIEENTGINCYRVWYCCLNKTECYSTGGYRWAFTGEIPRPIKFNKNQGKPVQKKTLFGEIVEKYDSITDAARCNGVSKASISNACNGKIESIDGFKYSFSK